MARPEALTQKAVVKWFKLQYPKLSKLLIKFDNEGKRTIAGHVEAKAMGLRPGASDLFLAYPTKIYSGLFLEIKPDKWTPGKANKEHYKRQLEFLDDMSKVGYAAELGIGFDECRAIIVKYISTDDINHLPKNTKD